MRARTVVMLAAMAAALLISAPPAAGTVSKSVPFELGAWTTLDEVDATVTLHRLRVVEQTGAFTKSNLFRPSGSEYLVTVQIQLEYTNTSTHDWNARIVVEWLDADGKVIDGYSGSEGLDRKEDHDVDTMTISTLKYGIEKAKTLRVKIDFGP